MFKIPVTNEIALDQPDLKWSEGLNVTLLDFSVARATVTPIGGRVDLDDEYQLPLCLVIPRVKLEDIFYVIPPSVGCDTKDNNPCSHYLLLNLTTGVRERVHFAEILSLESDEGNAQEFISTYLVRLRPGCYVPLADTLETTWSGRAVEIERV